MCLHTWIIVAKAGEFRWFDDKIVIEIWYRIDFVTPT